MFGSISWSSSGAGRGLCSSTSGIDFVCAGVFNVQILLLVFAQEGGQFLEVCWCSDVLEEFIVVIQMWDLSQERPFGVVSVEGVRGVEPRYNKPTLVVCSVQDALQSIQAEGFSLELQVQ